MSPATGRDRRRPLPFLQQTPTGRQLVVDGRPRLLLGGQLHNSSASSPVYMRPIWEHLATSGIRTVIGSVSWAQVEPAEGTFDFASVDAQIAEAGARGLRLVLIWFGAFKNAASTYAPGWVRADGQGVGLDFSFGAGVVEIDSVEEGRFESGCWVPGRALNGDERLLLLPGDDIGIVRIRLLRLPGREAAA